MFSSSPAQSLSCRSTSIQGLLRWSLTVCIHSRSIPHNLTYLKVRTEIHIEFRRCRVHGGREHPPVEYAESGEYFSRWYSPDSLPSSAYGRCHIAGTSSSLSPRRSSPTPATTCSE